MNVTKAVVRLREKMIRAINEAGLPPVVVGLVMDGIRSEIERLTAEELRKEDTEDAGNAEQAADGAAE